MDKRLRILIIHQVLAPYRVDFFNNFNKLHNVKLLLLKEQLVDTRLDPEKIKKDLEFTPVLLKKVIKILGRVIPYNIHSEIKVFQPDIVICPEFSLVNNIVLFYRLISGGNYKILTITEDNEYILQKPGSLLRQINRALLCKFLDGVISLDIEEVHNFYLKRFKKKNVISIHQHVRDQSKFRDTIKEVIPVKFDSKRKDEKKLRILFVGRLIPVKGLDVLIDAIYQLLQYTEEFQVYIVGEGDEQKNISSQIKNLSLDQYIFLEGKKEGLELLEYYSSCDLFVLPSRYEPFGAVVNEALISGLPVICTNNVGAKHMISEGVNGSIVKADDAMELYKAINKWLRKILDTEDFLEKKSLTKVDIRDEVRELSQFLIDLQEK